MSTHLLYCLILTLIFELSLALIIGYRKKEDIYTIILVNCLTNPIVVYTTNLVILNYKYIMGNIVLIILEILAVVVEGILYKKFLIKMKISPFVLSSILNIFSFSMGILISYIF